MSVEDTQHELHLQAYTSFDRSDILPDLGVAIDGAGGWLLDRRTLSAGVMQLHVELQEKTLPEMYCALLESGLELTRDSHRAVAQRCSCSLHLPRLGLGSVVVLRVDVHFVQAASSADFGSLLRLGAAVA